MIGPTHIAIAVSVGMVAGASPLSLGLMSAGAILPDLDCSRSTVGRIFFPVSMVLERWLGHRGAFHSFWLWSIVLLFGLIYRPILFVSAGCFIHIFSDCATVSGVRAMTPFSNKVFVFLKREWRVKTGSNSEMAIMLIFGIIAWAGYKVSSFGGINTMVGYFTGSPKIMMQEYIHAGHKKCYVEGKFRWANGKTDEILWLIIGKEGSGLAMQGEGRIIRTPKHGELLKARLKKTKDDWQVMNSRGWFKSESTCYFFSKGKWHHSNGGDVVYGTIIADNLSVSSFDAELY